MRPLILIIMDGFGLRKKKEGNAVALSKKPNYDSYLKNYSNTVLEASGEAVGLPKGTIGNSEVGHLNIGAGRLVMQDLSRINKAIKDKSFFKNKVLFETLNKVKKKGSALHLMGLLSDGGVHSHIAHLFALLEAAKKNNVEKVYVHVLTDGRDVEPRSATKYVRALEDYIKKLSVGKIASVVGRYFAMDRDKRWPRTELAYKAIVQGDGINQPSALAAVEAAYKKNESDEFITPTVIGDYGGMNDNDCVLFFNFRSDRARQLSWALVNNDFKEFITRNVKINFVCMSRYDDNLKVPIVFPPQNLVNILGEVFSKNKLKQLRIAETEKYAHVTFFFNGGVEKKFKNEDRILIPSPKVATYDLKPEMSAYEVTQTVIKKIESKNYQMIILNFANCDMVGHTGKLKEAIRAVEVVDDCVGRVVNIARKSGMIAVVSADHGNAEEMIGVHQTSHTTNPVPFIIISDKKYRLRKGRLGDIAPTILQLMGIKKPKEMSGKNLIVK